MALFGSDLLTTFLFAQKYVSTIWAFSSKNEGTILKRSSSWTWCCPNSLSKLEEGRFTAVKKRYLTRASVLVHRLHCRGAVPRHFGALRAALVGACSQKVAAASSSNESREIWRKGKERESYREGGERRRRRKRKDEEEEKGKKKKEEEKKKKKKE